MLPFIIFASAIFIAGPIENEGGRQAIQDKGLKVAAEQAWADRETFDYSKLNN